MYIEKKIKPKQLSKFLEKNPDIEISLSIKKRLL